jgi:hypothetical protein
MRQRFFPLANTEVFGSAAAMAFSALIDGWAVGPIVEHGD